MASHFSISFLLFILAYFVTYSSAAIASTLWQEEFEMKMTKMNELIETKNVQLEEKVTQLETQLKFNNELRKDLTLKVTRLEAKVQEQETILNFLLKATDELPVSPTGSKSIASNYRQNAIQSNGKSGIPRTCRELRAAYPSIASGMQFIDPDGQGIGDDPIFVFCDMSTGSTSIFHDSESPIDVGHCTDPGCYSRAINYNASIKQMKSLAKLSTECHQSIKYDCNEAPFELNNVVYAWWNDKDGNAQNFWAGNNTNGIHTCQCGIDGNCVDPALKCNCDSAAPFELVDDGVITDKNILPITRLNFGATSFGVHTLGHFVCSGSVALTEFPTSCEDLLLIGHTLNGLYSVMEGELVRSVHCDFTKLPSDASFESLIGYAEVKLKPTYFDIPTSCANLKAAGHTSSGLYLVMEGELVKSVHCNFTKLPSDASFERLIGYAEVKPKPTYFDIPTSCANLKAAGHTSSGLYSVMGAKMIENVYCDFTKLPSDSDFQKWIGYADVKSAPVHFYVQRNSIYNTIGTPIPFELARVNEGNAMNLQTGKFTAPRPGIYFFSFTGLAGFPASSSVMHLGVSLYLNGGQIGTGWVEEANTVRDQDSPLTLQSTLNLKKGDQVWMEIFWQSTGVVLYEYNGHHYTHFTGFMLEEEIVASL